MKRSILNTLLNVLSIIFIVFLMIKVSVPMGEHTTSIIYNI